MHVYWKLWRIGFNAVICQGVLLNVFILLERTDYVGQMTDETRGESLHSHSSQAVAVIGHTIPDMSFSAYSLCAAWVDGLSILILFSPGSTIGLNMETREIFLQ